MKLSRLLLSLVALVVLAGVAYVNQATESSAGKMAGAAEKFLGTLTADQKTKATFPFDNPERLNWHFVPREKDKKSTRKGLSLEEMTKEQKAAALELLKASTSAEGYTKAVTVMSLEGILLDAEKGKGPVRNTEWYFFTVFGNPSKTGQWGWRLEGHHLALNFTLDKGQVVAATPAVFGANPAVVKNGPKQGLRTLPEAELPVKALFDALSDDQKQTVVQKTKLPEIKGLTPAPNVGEPIGLAAAKMTAKQKELLVKVVQGYADRMPADVSAAYMAEVKQAGIDKIHFALHGTAEQGKPYTYRVHGPTFVIEFLNEQPDGYKNAANHIHSGWRNTKGDFGVVAK